MALRQVAGPEISITTRVFTTSSGGNIEMLYGEEYGKALCSMRSLQMRKTWLDQRTERALGE